MPRRVDCAVLWGGEELKQSTSELAMSNLLRLETNLHVGVDWLKLDCGRLLVVGGC